MKEGGIWKKIITSGRNRPSQTTDPSGRTQKLKLGSDQDEGTSV